MTVELLQTAACYVMPFMEGGSLLTMLDKMKRLPEAVAQFYAAEIVLAVAFLHERGIVHR
jgi:protein kinase A